MSRLIIGGAGYIGSHVVEAFRRRGENPVVLDNLSTGHRDAIGDVPFIEGDCRDRELVEKILKDHKIHSVLHFAAHSLVGESMVSPEKYYDNNVGGFLSLLRAMAAAQVKELVFSSTAAVYGEPEKTPIVEESPTHPTNPYGETKLAMETMMKWFEGPYGIRSVALRYFNAAGAGGHGLGERHHPETHLIPLILQVPLGKRDKISIYGDDYPTPDGTAIRDYIHVNDLAQAHVAAAEYLENGGPSTVCNLGIGKGYSVKEVIETAREVTGHRIPAQVTPRRPGDPAILVASGDKARQLLGWSPEYHLRHIIQDAWDFHRNFEESSEDVKKNR